MTRRELLRALGVGTAGLCLPAQARPSARQYRFGYAAITWGGNDRQAIEDIGSLGFRGIQIRANAVKTWGDNPNQLKDLLAQHRLEFVALSSGTVSGDPNAEAAELALHTRNARFVRDVGGRYLQVVDQRPTGREIAADDYRRLADRLNALGRRTAELGVPLGYHNHMNSLGEAPDEVDRIVKALDPRYVKLELDVAHYAQGGGDPVRAIERYGNDLLFMHLKDVESRPPQAGQPANRAFRFVELGRGRVDLPGIFRALARTSFDGWIVVELDAVPDNAGTPKASGEINKRYITDVLGLSI